MPQAGEIVDRNDGAVEIVRADGRPLVNAFVVDDDMRIAPLVEQLAVGLDVLGQHQHETVGHAADEVGDIFRLAGLMVGREEQHLVVGLGDLGVDAADDLADVAGAQIAHQQADHAGTSGAQTARLAVGNVPHPVQRYHHPIARSPA